MTKNEILSAAKESKGDLEAFIKIVERKTIERCAVECEFWKFKNPYSREATFYNDALSHAADAIRKLGEE